MPTIYVLSKNLKIVKQFQLKIVIFTAVKKGCILHGRFFVMTRLKYMYANDEDTAFNIM